MKGNTLHWIILRPLFIWTTVCLHNYSSFFSLWPGWTQPHVTTGTPLLLVSVKYPVWVGPAWSHVNGWNGWDISDMLGTLYSFAVDKSFTQAWSGLRTHSWVCCVTAAAQRLWVRNGIKWSSNISHAVVWRLHYHGSFYLGVGKQIVKIFYNAMAGLQTEKNNKLNLNLAQLYITDLSRITVFKWFVICWLKRELDSATFLTFLTNSERQKHKCYCKDLHRW